MFKIILVIGLFFSLANAQSLQRYQMERAVNEIIKGIDDYVRSDKAYKGFATTKYELERKFADDSSWGYDFDKVQAGLKEYARDMGCKYDMKGFVRNRIGMNGLAEDLFEKHLDKFIDICMQKLDKVGKI